MAADQTAQEKGDALERAVRVIETVILRSAPNYAEETFTIESKKRLTISGVRHEVDIYVRVTPARGYEALFIFECKNWDAEKVGKEKILSFSKLVDITKAQSGYFVAKSFSSDAVAQAALEPRVKLLRADELDPASLVAPGFFHGIQATTFNSNVDVIVGHHDPASVNSAPVDYASTQFVLNDTACDLKAYQNAWTQEVVNERAKRFDSISAAEGSHTLEFTDQRTFKRGEAFVNGHVVKRMSLTGTVDVHVGKAVVTSAFDVATRGRVISTRITLPGGIVEAHFVSVQPDASYAT